MRLLRSFSFLRRATGVAFAVVAGVLASRAPAATGADSRASVAHGPAAAGQRAPAFVLERVTGGEMSLANFAGRPLLINVFAAWCGNCRLEEPLLTRAYAKFRDRVTFLGIDEQEGVARATAFAKELHVPYPIALDAGPFAASYGTSKIPETILIDASGYVRAVYRGLISGPELDRTLVKLVAGKG